MEMASTKCAQYIYTDGRVIKPLLQKKVKKRNIINQQWV